MEYYTVLGYEKNPILEEYFKKYFCKLEDIFKNMETSVTYDCFCWLDQWLKESFLLHPDISSLFHDISKEDKKKIVSELEYFVAHHGVHMTGSQWDFIKGTNIKLTINDNNPRNTFVWHPDHDQEGWMLWWWDKSESEWHDVFSKSFALLRDINTSFYIELNEIIKKIVPMKTSIDVHNSCSYAECIWTLYLWYTINGGFPELNILEALIHESSHNKLNLIMQSEKLHVNDYSLQYYSPYRPDARHIQGVLLGVHAIVPTVYILLQAIDKGFVTDSNWLEKTLVYHVKNKLGYNVLKRHAKFTPIWRKIFNDMWQVMQLCDSIIKNNVELQAIDFNDIQTRTKAHFIEVRNNYPYLQY